METYSLSLDSVDTITYATFLEEDWEDISSEYYVFSFVKVMCIICYSITFLLGIMGNGLVIWIAGFKMKKSVNTIWFLNLGITDFTFNVFIPLQIIECAMDGYWPFGQIICKAMSTIIFLNMSVSTSFLMVISMDRCTSVLYPVWSKNHRNSRSAYIISFVIWLSCLILSSPYVAFYDVEHNVNDSESYCFETYASWQNETTFDYETWKLRDNAMYVTRFVSMFLIPFSMILVCYGLIAYKVRKSKNLAGSGRTFKIIIIIIASFFCCWFPFHFWPVFEFMDHGFSFTVDFLVFNIAVCLAYFNSCVNPLLYVFVGRDFKKSLLKSIPFILENTFKEKGDLDSTNRCDQTMLETELESMHS